MGIMKDFRNWREYRRTVNELSRLPDATLRDIGVDPSAVEKHARRIVGY